MIYVETGSEDVYYNFGLEYYFTVEKRLPEPVFLFWRTTPTLMVGKYQNTLEEINGPYAEAHGIHIVRRMSGGGTIYTDPGGWQFTFIDYGDSDEIHFQEYIAPVIDALRALGIPAEFNGRNDLVIEGKKFSGNAQYKLAGNTVHHGSLLYATDIAQMVAATTVDEYKILSKSIKSVRDRVTNISEHMQTPLSPEAFKEHMISYILRGGGRYELTDADRARIRELAAERFDNWQSIYGQNPKFQIVKTGRLPGGKMEFHLDVQKGRITGAAVYGDFFASQKADGLAALLTGCEYSRAAVQQALEDGGMRGAIYGASPEEMAAVIAD